MCHLVARAWEGSACNDVVQSVLLLYSDRNPSYTCDSTNLNGLVSGICWGWRVFPCGAALVTEDATVSKKLYKQDSRPWPAARWCQTLFSCLSAERSKNTCVWGEQADI